MRRGAHRSLAISGEHSPVGRTEGRFVLGGLAKRRFVRFVPGGKGVSEAWASLPSCGGACCDGQSYASTAMGSALFIDDMKANSTVLEEIMQLFLALLQVLRGTPQLGHVLEAIDRAHQPAVFPE